MESVIVQKFETMNKFYDRRGLSSFLENALNPGDNRVKVRTDRRSARSKQRTNTSAFTIAPQFTIGNSSRNPLRGPRYRNADVALIKRTYFGENRNIEFRAEVFNLTNTPPLGAPNVVAGAAGFGSITSAGDPRVVQFGVKVNF